MAVLSFLLLHEESTFQHPKAVEVVDNPPPSPGGKTEDSCLQENDRLYWITTLPSGERTAKRLSDDVEVNVPKANVCIMSDPQTSQVKIQHCMTWGFTCINFNIQYVWPNR